jgi:hypothetical protein
MADNYRGGEEAEDELQGKVWDPYSHSMTVISEPHRMIHDGFYFDLTGKGALLADAATVDILFKFPLGVIGHMTTVEWSMDDAPADIDFYENVLVSADGTPLTARNHNRVYAAANGDVPGTTLFQDPTITDIGDLLHARYVPGSGGPAGQTGGSLVEGENSEWVIGNGVNYMWRFTNNSGGAISWAFHFNGYVIGYEN